MVIVVVSRPVGRRTFVIVVQTTPVLVNNRNETNVLKCAANISSFACTATACIVSRIVYDLLPGGIRWRNDGGNLLVSQLQDVSTKEAFVVHVASYTCTSMKCNFFTVLRSFGVIRYGISRSPVTTGRRRQQEFILVSSALASLHIFTRLYVICMPTRKCIKSTSPCFPAKPWLRYCTVATTSICQKYYSTFKFKPIHRELGPWIFSVLLAIFRAFSWIPSSFSCQRDAPSPLLRRTAASPKKKTLPPIRETCQWHHVVAVLIGWRKTCHRRFHHFPKACRPEKPTTPIRLS